MSVFNLPNAVVDSLDALDLHQLTALQFVVQIDGEGLVGKELVAGFRQVDGLDAELEVSALREGGYPGVHTFPRRELQSTMVLRRPVTFSRALWNWYLDCRNWQKGKPDYTRTLSIFLLDRLSLPGVGEVVYEAWRWDIFRAWISRWAGPRLNANSDTLAVEEVTIQHAGIVEAKGVLSGTAGEILSIFQ